MTCACITKVPVSTSFCLCFCSLTAVPISCPLRLALLLLLLVRCPLLSPLSPRIPPCSAFYFLFSVLFSGLKVGALSRAQPAEYVLGCSQAASCSLAQWPPTRGQRERCHRTYHYCFVKNQTPSEGLVEQGKGKLVASCPPKDSRRRKLGEMQSANNATACLRKGRPERIYVECDWETRCYGRHKQVLGLEIESL
jgi:hypothetical protein